MVITKAGKCNITDPRMAVPVATLISRLIAFSIQFALFLVILTWFSFSSDAVNPNLWILLTPLLILMMATVGLGGGIIISSLTTRYRDLAVLVGFGVQLLMFATPIIYPLSSLPERWQFWASLNPIAPLVEAFRYAYLGHGMLDLSMLMVSGLMIVTTLLVGMVLFNRVERTFMDTV